MKSLLLILMLTLFTFSCDIFTNDKIIENQDELMDIIKIAQKNDIHKFSLGDPDREGLNWKLQKHQIDQFEVQLNGYTQTGMVTDLDSVVIFTRKSRDIFDNEDKIVYDLASVPRKSGSFVIRNASYEQTMITDRWYLVTIGFD